MNKFAISISALILAANVHAGPVDFSEAVLFVDTFAGLDQTDTSASDSLVIPSGNFIDDLPLSASASQAGQAFADAFIDLNQGSLVVDATTETNSVNGELSDASAISEFQGMFSGAASYSFSLDFNVQSVLSDLLGDSTSAEVFAEIMVDGDTIFSQSLMTSGQLIHHFVLGDMSNATLDVLLTSSSNSSAPSSSAFNLSSANIELRTLNIPEPSSLLLIGSTLFGIGVLRRNTTPTFA